MAQLQASFSGQSTHPEQPNATVKIQPFAYDPRATEFQFENPAQCPPPVLERPSAALTAIVRRKTVVEGKDLIKNVITIRPEYYATYHLLYNCLQTHILEEMYDAYLDCDANTEGETHLERRGLGGATFERMRPILPWLPKPELTNFAESVAEMARNEPSWESVRNTVKLRRAQSQPELSPDNSSIEPERDSSDEETPPMITWATIMGAEFHNAADPCTYNMNDLREAAPLVIAQPDAVGERLEQDNHRLASTNRVREEVPLTDAQPAAAEETRKQEGLHEANNNKDTALWLDTEWEDWDATLLEMLPEYASPDFCKGSRHAKAIASPWTTGNHCRFVMEDWNLDKIDLQTESEVTSLFKNIFGSAVGRKEPSRQTTIIFPRPAKEHRYW